MFLLASPRLVLVVLNPIALTDLLLCGDCTKWSPILELLLILLFIEKKLPELDRLLNGLLLKKLERPFLRFPVYRKDMFFRFPTEGLVNAILGHDISWAELSKDPPIINKVGNRYVTNLIIKAKT